MTEWKWQLRYEMQRKKRTAPAAGTVLLMGQEGVSSFLSSTNFNQKEQGSNETSVLCGYCADGGTL